MRLAHPHLAVAIALTLMSGMSATQAQTAAATPPGKHAVVDGASITVVGEITAVDAAQRVVSIRGPQGRVAEYAVDPVVRNLDQVKVGDRVQLDYKAAVALALVKGGDGIREKVEAESVTTSTPGSKPGGAVLKTTTIAATVVSVDHKKKLARLKGPEGREVDVEVRDPKVLETVKAGDQVVANVTESVAINVRPAPAKK
jgi:hypothetical protein